MNVFGLIVTIPRPTGYHPDMPELPDVEVFRRRIARTTLHREIERVQVRDPALLHGVDAGGLERALQGSTFEGTSRHGKNLAVDVSGGGVLVLHFGMTGHPETEEPGLSDRHVRLVIGFSDGGRLAVVDQRRLGRVALADDLGEYAARAGLGPDALSLGPAALRGVMRESRGGVKATLMDQGQLAGMGNIYADEVLFQARIDPRAQAASLDEVAYLRLHRRLHRVVRIAVERDADPGRLPRTWLITHREDGVPCPRGNGEVRRFRSGGRAGYWCPACQDG